MIKWMMPEPYSCLVYYGDQKYKGNKCNEIIGAVFKKVADVIGQGRLLPEVLRPVPSTVFCPGPSGGALPAGPSYC